MFVCMLVTYLLRNGWTDLAKFFLLAPSWSRDGFRLKKFRIRDPVFPEIRKNPDFRVLLLYPFFECTIIGRSPETQIAAKPLDASGEAASSKYSFISLLYSCRGKKSIMYLKLVSCPFKSALYPTTPSVFRSKTHCVNTVYIYSQTAYILTIL